MPAYRNPRTLGPGRGNVRQRKLVEVSSSVLLGPLRNPCPHMEGERAEQAHGVGVGAVIGGGAVLMLLAVRGMARGRPGILVPVVPLGARGVVCDGSIDGLVMDGAVAR